MWEKYGFAWASKYRQKVLLSLEERPKTPMQISIEISVNLTHVSRALRELAKKGIVECITPKMVKGRIYKLTTKGKEVVKLLKSK
ncbi:MAG: hypothetical protein QMC80_08120 [Thermoplasmatales archaeon]|nr:hypothetical protein [Thermoplasmatales archaeon]